MQNLSSFFQDYCTNLDQFISKLPEEENFVPMGEMIQSFTGPDETYQVFKVCRLFIMLIQCMFTETTVHVGRHIILTLYKIERNFPGPDRTRKRGIQV